MCPQLYEFPSYSEPTHAHNYQSHPVRKMILRCHYAQEPKAGASLLFLKPPLLDALSSLESHTLHGCDPRLLVSLPQIGTPFYALGKVVQIHSLGLLFPGIHTPIFSPPQPLLSLLSKTLNSSALIPGIGPK